MTPTLFCPVSLTCDRSKNQKFISSSFLLEATAVVIEAPMADIVLSPLLQVIFDRLASPVLQKLGDSWDLKDNFQKLQGLLPIIQALLEDAEEQQVRNKAVRMWLSKLKDAADDAEDVLDELAVKGVLEDSGALELLLFGEDELRKMLQRLEMTAVEGLQLHLREGARVDSPIDKRETSSFVIESEVYGREEDKEKIVMLLSCETTQGGNVSFIPIIGMGGLGKTTLAQLAYNDARVNQRFDVKFWIFVSDHFDAKKIMKSAIESATNSTCDFLELDVLQSKLWGLLHKKRYLLVLDDLWNEDQDEWDKLRPFFRSGVDGSKIIVTTRSKKVGLLIDGPTFPYYLKGLPEDDCWNLFKKRAFYQGEEEEYPNLFPIGKSIVKKCGGVPLAAKTLGSLMRFKREEREWLFVQNSELWNLDACQSGLIPALGLSYFHLPPHLKRCFVFCAIFPKYYDIKKEKLIHLWMAEGLILSAEGGKPPEDIGNDYFNDLLWMSFFQDVDSCNDGGITGYRMHDIIHDLARSVAGKGSLILEHGLPASSLASTRRSSVVSDFKTSTIPEALYEAKHLRTLLLFPGGGFVETPHKLFSSFKYLRVLDLNGCGLIRLDESIGGLRCLRYIDLSYTHVKSLPDTIYDLCRLQTLNLFNCYNLVALPDIRKLKSLRHLIITGCEALTGMLPYIPFTERQMLTYVSHFEASFHHPLHTLPLFIVGGLLDLVLLGRLNLQGELKITQLENVRSADAAKKAKLVKKESLESLGLYWGNNYHGLDLYPLVEANIARFSSGPSKGQLHSSRPSRGCELDATLGEEVIKCLQPHQNLKQLFVNGYPGIRFPYWTLPNLIGVDLINFKNCEHLPVLGNLQSLKTLSLSGMAAVMRIGMEFYGGGTQRPFPSLKELVLEGFPNLEEWLSADDEYAFPRLRKVIVNKCPRLTAMPLFRSLQHLELRDCNPMILKSIENLKYLLILAIEKVPELYSLSGRLLARNSLLTSLEIISCPNLCSLPSELGNLTSLKSLIIRWCEELSSLPQDLQNLKALESLEISDCHSMVSLPNHGIGSLSSLRTLSIENCSNLVSLSTSFQHLTSLECLTIMYCPSLGSLPEGVQHLSALRSLSLLSCPELLSLPEGLQYVTTLQSLEIRSCPGLTVLPEWVENLASLRSLSISDCYNLKCLPKGLKVLSALQHLSIQDCPELQERCKQESGEDWLNIVHIPHIHIGSPEYRQSTAASSSSGGN
ncbi:hypothetical protein L1049_015643 [Liquidambar formosana]|uniref:Uncharacterized protein n=1 Tax=Liquidambar formosana TaxID=63359 RepID=A0AAP0X6P4_LIQFO